jgi:2-iminobutanoate/2-iminopropanoate deaminase
MEKKVILTKDAPAPIGPYSQAIFINSTLYISGQIALDPKTGKFINDDIVEETHQVMKNVEAILKEAGLSLDNVVKSTIFLKNMDDFTAVNKIYSEYFRIEPPARETVEVSRLPKDANVEISCIAVK